MDEAEPNLKVTDRRHFTADGEVRPEAAATPPAAEPEARPRAAPEVSEAPPVTFSSFIVSLATQAADFMGGEQKNLAAVRQIIGALEMLKDKSEGRRTEDESRIMDAILFDLRLAFVGSAKGSRT